MVAVQSEESRQMTEAEYLAFEDSSEFKHEFSRGRVYAMTGGSLHHSVITANIIINLGSQLEGRNCTVASSDLCIHITSRSAYRYPDITIFCGDLVFLKDRTDTITNPVVLVEVLSPGTALQDHNEKLLEYTQIESLQAYLLVAQDKPQVERFMRHESGDWLYSVFSGLEREIALPSIECTLGLSNVYQKITFDEPDTDNGQ